VFDDVPEIVSALLCIDVSTSQVYRSCQVASQALDEELLHTASEEIQQQLESKQETVYGMVDGSMLLMDNGWQETKVGRVFTAPAIEKADSDILEWQMGQSEYVAKRGNYHNFTTEFETLLPSESNAKKVFITDGAIWIDNWLSSTYPEATHILDYFHVAEKVGAASEYAPNQKQWYKRQCEQLLNGKSKEVMQAVEELPMPAAEKDRLACYLENNHHRMRYDEYRQRKLMISSGPIEAAHRTLLQVRMKRSGQRWSEKGADNIIRLRTALVSEKFELVFDLFRKNEA
jgi:hypothetical protein